jgi:hypothetical protein
MEHESGVCTRLRDDCLGHGLGAIPEGTVCNGDLQEAAIHALPLSSAFGKLQEMLCCSLMGLLFTISWRTGGLLGELSYVFVYLHRRSRSCMRSINHT